jgi:hypothetical protein
MNLSLQRVVRAVRSIPPGSMLTVSSDLVDTLLVQLILKLQPLHGDGYRQLGQQKLLALTLQVGPGNTNVLLALLLSVGPNYSITAHAIHR